jgi:Sulfotransferase domain
MEACDEKDEVVYSAGGIKVTRSSDRDKCVISAVVTQTSGETLIFKHPPQSIVKGITCPPVCNEERWLNLNENIRYKTGDVIVCSYPKSGTTWIEQVVLLLQHGGDATLLNPANKNVYSPSSSSAVGKIWPEACIEQAPGAAVAGQEFARISWEDFDSAPSPRLIKSHAPSKLLLGIILLLKKL